MVIEQTAVSDFYNASSSSPTRAIFSGGGLSVNTMDAVEIMTTGNAFDFGDLTQGRLAKWWHFQRSRRFIIMSEFKTSGFRDEFGSGGPDLVGITTMTSPYYFVPPSGSTAERPSSPPPGMLRFNTDIGRLEVWRNDHWATILGESPNLGDQNNSNSLVEQELVDYLLVV